MFDSTTHYPAPYLLPSPGQIELNILNLQGRTSQIIEANARTGFVLTLFCKLHREPTETNTQEISETYTSTCTVLYNFNLYMYRTLELVVQIEIIHVPYSGTCTISIAHIFPLHSFSNKYIFYKITVKTSLKIKTFDFHDQFTQNHTRSILI